MHPNSTEFAVKGALALHQAVDHLKERAFPEGLRLAVVGIAVWRGSLGVGTSNEGPYDHHINGPFAYNFCVVQPVPEQHQRRRKEECPGAKGHHGSSRVDRELLIQPDECTQGQRHRAATKKVKGMSLKFGGHGLF